jgi:surface protein
VSTSGALLAAIDMYLNGEINIPIGEWDVSQITDFSLAFSASRNPKAASFNEDLNNWDTSRATSMRRMVRCAPESFVSSDYFSLILVLGCRII